jgi:hypothetical protein
VRGFNLAKFKKIKEDKDWATLIHEDGHTINIAKAPLLPIQRKQLENLETHEQNQYAEGGDVPSTDGPAESQPSALESILADTHADEPNPPPPPQSAPSNPIPQPPPTTTSAPSSPSSAQSLGQAQNAGLGQEQAGNTALAQAQGQEGTNQANAYEQTAKAIKAIPTQQAVIAANKDKDDALANAFAAQKIDPDHYFQDHSKVAAGIGILLSSLGQGIGMGKVQNNGALDVIQNGINRDIEAQKANQGQSLTLWQMNRQALGNDLAANAATQNQMYTALQAKIAQTAAASQKPIALANAQINNAKIQQIKDANNFKLSLLNPTSDNPDPSTRIPLLVPPDKQKEVAMKVDAAKNVVTAAPSIYDAFQQSAKEVRPLTGGIGTSPTAFIPGQQSPGQKAFLARIFPTVQEEEGSVRQTAFDNIEHHLLPQFGDSDATIASKRASLDTYLRSKSAATLPKAYGIDLEKFPSTRTSTIGQAAQPQMKVVNGVTYTRGPNGQAIPVR